MTRKKLSKSEKEAELKKYRDLVSATLDYYIEKKAYPFSTANSIEHFQKLKQLTEEHFQKERLTLLKQWFRDMTEMQIEVRDLNFNEYLRNRTKHDVDIFKSYFKRLEEIVKKGKITTDNQFYDLNILVDQLSQTEPVDSERIEILNTLLRKYEQRNARRNAGF